MTAHDQRGLSELPTAPLPVVGRLAPPLVSVPGQLPSGEAGQGKPLRARQSVSAFGAGVVTAALVIMALGMIVAQIYSAANAEPGPGPIAVGAHIVAAIGAVPLYRVARRRDGRARWLAGGALLVLMLLVLWFYWWVA
jgi:hypothetical protein